MREIIETFLNEAMEYHDLPGLVIGVWNRGEVVTGARGLRDVTTGDPLQEDDVFHCASVSKLFTSAAIMKLVEAGALDLKDRLCDVLPELFEAEESDAGPCREQGNGKLRDPRWQDVQIWQMLSHTAGIGDVQDYHWEEALTGEKALSDYVHSPEVTDQPLLWAPGTGGFRYSNIAYEILGHIVSAKAGAYLKATGSEVTTPTDGKRGMSYEAFVKRFLMEPAGMKDSTMLTCGRFGKAFPENGLITEEIRRRNGNPDASSWHPMALPHEKAEDRSIVPVKYYPYTRSHAPSSTLTSTAADLLRWAEVHMKGFAAVEKAAAGEAGVDPLLSFDSYQHMQYEYAEVPNNREKMGLGWFMRRQGGYQLYGHEGTDDGFRASLWICPEKELAIAVLSNLSGAPVKKLNKKLFERLTETD